MATHTGPHKYVRVKIGRSGRIVFKCSIPGCVHHIREELAEGRLTICHRCNNEIVLTKLNMKLAKPHCDDCTVRKNKSVDVIADLIKDLNLG
jgi:hypothetical protein